MLASVRKSVYIYVMKETKTREITVKEYVKERGGNLRYIQQVLKDKNTHRIEGFVSSRMVGGTYLITLSQ